MLLPIAILIVSERHSNRDRRRAAAERGGGGAAGHKLRAYLHDMWSFHCALPLPTRRQVVSLSHKGLHKYSGLCTQAATYHIFGGCRKIIHDVWCSPGGLTSALRNSRESTPYSRHKSVLLPFYYGGPYQRCALQRAEADHANNRFPLQGAVGCSS